MKSTLALLVALALPIAALAQGAAPITATPLLPPPTTDAPQLAPNLVQQPPPPPVDQTQTQPAPQPQPVPPGTAPQEATGAPAAPATPPQPIQLTWVPVPQGSAQLQVLDKVNAQNATLTVKIGQQGQYGSLTIQVQACDIHPQDQPQDAAAYLKITDGHANEPGFQGWMLANNPSVSMLQNPIYDVRVVGCQA
jgi:hypothetical protein